MTILETRERIEKELIAAKESFGEASALVSYSIDIDVNLIEGAPEDITYVFGSLAFGAPDADENDKLYLPLDAELSDDDTVDEEAFEKTLEVFHARVDEIRERVLASDDYAAEIQAIIADFDRDIEEKYLAEVERLAKLRKRDLLIASGAMLAALVFAMAIFLIKKLA